MKPKIDWISIIAAVSVGYVAHIIMTADSVIFPAFIGAVLLQFLVSRIARPS